MLPLSLRNFGASKRLGAEFRCIDEPSVDLCPRFGSKHPGQVSEEKNEFLNKKCNSKVKPSKLLIFIELLEQFDTGTLL